MSILRRKKCDGHFVIFSSWRLFIITVWLWHRHHKVPQQRLVANAALSSSSFFCNTVFNWIGNHETGGYITMPTRDIFLSLQLCPHPISSVHTHTLSLSPTATHFHKRAPVACLHPQFNSYDLMLPPADIYDCVHPRPCICYPHRPICFSYLAPQIKYVFTIFTPPLSLKRIFFF